MSFLEGLFARGDRRLAKVVHHAFANGCRLDEWEEHLDFALWQKTIAETGVDTDFYLHRLRGENEVLPWDHLFSQLLKSWLWEERENARIEAYRADCSLEKCAAFCGACDFKVIKNRIYVIDEKALAAKKGNREWYGRYGEKPPEEGEELSPSPCKGEGQGEGSPTVPHDKFKIRIYFSKTELAALFGHLELMSHLKRAILRTGAPVAYSEGFHPQMKLALGYALPLGLESDCESCDLVLHQEIDLALFLEHLNDALPLGLRAQKIEYIDLKSPSIYSSTQAVSYRIEFPEALGLAHLQESVAELRNGKDFTVIRERKDKPGKSRTFSLSQVVRISDSPFTDQKIFEFTALCDPEGSVKPTEVVGALSGLAESELAQVKIRKVKVHYVN